MTGDLYARGERLEALLAQLTGMPSWTLDERAACDLELLLDGVFAPLGGYLGEDDYRRVAAQARLADGSAWGLPVTLKVSETFSARTPISSQIALTDAEGVPLAVLDVEAKWACDPALEAALLHHTQDPWRSGQREALDTEGLVHLGGTVTGLQAPVHYDFVSLRPNRTDVQAHFAALGWKRVLGYIPEFLLHPAEVQASSDHAKALDAGLLVAPIADPVPADERAHFARLRCLEAAWQTYPAGHALMRLLSLAERGKPSRRRLGRLQVLRNLGCTHVLIEPQDVTDESLAWARELGIELVESGLEPSISHSELGAIAHGHDRLAQGRVLPEVIRELERLFPPPQHCGYTVFFTGLSGSGKSTIANALAAKLRAREARRITLLDGDLVRTHLSSELGFSRRDRDLNIQRIGFVAQQITGNGGAAICAPIAPYAATRRLVREMIEPLGGFVEVHVATPLAICEQRDRKGLYAKARAGLIKEFTGIDDPYEAPEDPELRIDTPAQRAGKAADTVIALLEQRGYL